MRKTGCKRLMFTQRGLFIFGSIFMVFGFVCVILNKSLTKSLSGKIWSTVNLIDVKKYSAQLVDTKDVSLYGFLNITGSITEASARNVYYYSPPDNINVTYRFTLVNITANISVFVSAEIPPIPTLVTPLWKPFNACGVTYFNFFNASKINQTYSALFHIDSFDSEICTFKWLTALFPAAATLLLLGGCVAVAYWGYEKMTHPEEEMYNVVGTGRLKIQNF